MTITTASNPKLLWPGLNKVWGTEYQEHPKEYPFLFDVSKSEQAYEEDQEMTGFNYLSVKSQAGSITYQDQFQGYTTRYVPVEYASGFIVTRAERDDNLYWRVAAQRTAALAFAARQTKETVAALVYNRAFNASYVGGDGVEMCATNHPSLAGNQSNELPVAADLSEAALEDMVIQISTATDNRGMPIALLPSMLIIPPQLKFEAERILKSTQQSGTANNDINALKSLGMFSNGAVVNHYLTDPDAWFVRTNLKNALRLFERVPIEFQDDGDFDTYNHKYKVYERYSVGWSDWRGIFGSPGA